MFSSRRNCSKVSLFTKNPIDGASIKDSYLHLNFFIFDKQQVDFEIIQEFKITPEYKIVNVSFILKVEDNAFAKLFRMLAMKNNHNIKINFHGTVFCPHRVVNLYCN